MILADLGAQSLDDTRPVKELHPLSTTARLTRRALTVPVVAAALAAGLTGAAGYAHSHHVQHTLTQEILAADAHLRVLTDVVAARADQTLWQTQRATHQRSQAEQVRERHAQYQHQTEQTLMDAGALLTRAEGKATTTTRAALRDAIDQLHTAGTTWSAIDNAIEQVTTAAAHVATSLERWEAEQERAAEQARQVAAQRAAQLATTTTDVTDTAASTLRDLPGSSGITIDWNDPGLGTHLGGVWSDGPDTILLNPQRLTGKHALTRDVVRHEIAHVYQNRLARNNALTYTDLDARMTGAFGSNASEKAADCVAKHFGATWTHYTSQCAGTDKQTWVQALIGGYLP